MIFVPLAMNPVGINDYYNKLKVYKSIGLYIKKQKKKKTDLNLLTVSPVISFYASANHFYFNKEKSVEELIDDIYTKNIDYVIGEKKILYKLYKRKFNSFCLNRNLMVYKDLKAGLDILETDHCKREIDN